MNLFHRISSDVPVLTTLHKIIRNDWWDLDTARTGFEKSPHQQVHDILLRCCQTEGRTLSEAYVDLDAVDREVFQQLPEARGIALDLMRFVGGSRLGRVVVTRLEPGCKIAKHRDEGAYAEYYDRYHVVLQGLPGSVFTCGDEAVQMMTGDIWWVNVREPHEVSNNSSDDRIHMIVDIRVDK